MPIYEYQCKKCNQELEVIQKFSDEPLKTHEDCGGELQKKMSLSSFSLKGTGWYTTDYKRSGTGSKTTTTEKKPESPKADPKPSV